MPPPTHSGPDFGEFRENIACCQHFALAVRRLPSFANGWLTHKWEIMPLCECAVRFSALMCRSTRLSECTCMCMIRWKAEHQSEKVQLKNKKEEKLCRSEKDRALYGHERSLLQCSSSAHLQMISDIIWHWGQPCSHLQGCGKPPRPTSVVLNPLESHYFPHQHLQCIFHQMSHYNLQEYKPALLFFPLKFSDVSYRRKSQGMVGRRQQNDKWESFLRLVFVLINCSYLPLLCLILVVFLHIWPILSECLTYSKEYCKFKEKYIFSCFLHWYMW